MKQKEFIREYWNYYLLLENKFLNTLNYVELSDEKDKKDEKDKNDNYYNYSTFSKEYMSQIYTIGAEIDTVLKVICGFNQKKKDKYEKIYRIYKEKVSRDTKYRS